MLVDRQTRCYLGWKVVEERTQQDIQSIVDDAPKAKWYFSDAFEEYAQLWYHFGRYEVSEGKADTYSVEADNAELRHYLARLARKSRCFSRCPHALECALRYLSIASIVVNCINSASLITLPMSEFSFHHIFSHSRDKKGIYECKILL
jgi:IS1 family transposase